MVKRIFAIVGVILFLIPSFVYSQEMLKFRLGILPVIDTLPLVVGKERGIFKDQGVDMSLVSFNSALERDAALRAGRIDGYFGDLLNTILLANSGENLKIITQVYHTMLRQYMFALVASPGSGIKTIDQIKDVPIAISSASIIEYFLDEMLSRADIPISFVKKMEVRTIPIRYQMLMGGSVKLALLPEPLATMAISGGAVLIADDKMLDITATIVAIRGNVLQAYPRLATQFLGAYGKAVHMINENPDAFKDILVKKTRFPASLKEQYSIPPFPDPAPPSETDVTRVQTWLVHKGLLSKELAYKNLVWTGYVKG